MTKEEFEPMFHGKMEAAEVLDKTVQGGFNCKWRIRKLSTKPAGY